MIPPVKASQVADPDAGSSVTAAPSDDAQIPLSMLGMASPMDNLTTSLKSKAESLVPKLAAVRDAEAQTDAQASKAEAEEDKKYREQLADIYKNYKPETVDYGGQPNQPEQNPLKQFGSLASMLGIFGSAFTKRPAINALNASASAMNSIRAGDTEAYNNSYKAWKDHTELALKKNQEDHEFLQDKLGEAKTDNAAALAEIKAYAAANNWPAASLLAQAGDLEGLARLSKSLESATGKMTNFKNVMLQQGVQEFINNNGRPPNFKEMAEINNTAAGKAEATPLSDDAVNVAAAQIYTSGDITALQGLGYGSVGQNTKNRIKNAITERGKSEGLSADQIANKIKNAEIAFAGQKKEVTTLEGQLAYTEAASESVGGAAKLLKDASAAVDRNRFPTVNRAELALQQGLGTQDEMDALAQFDVALDTLATERARSLNPKGTVTEGEKSRSKEILMKTYGDKTIDAAVDQIIKENKNLKDSVRAARKQALSGGAADDSDIPQAAIERLKKDPSLAKDFEEHFHVPASNYLGQ